MLLTSRRAQVRIFMKYDLLTSVRYVTTTRQHAFSCKILPSHKAMNNFFGAPKKSIDKTQHHFLNQSQVRKAKNTRWFGSMTKSYVESIQRPKRARSAYNFFFRSERAKLLGVTENELCIRDQQKRKHRKTPGMIGFAKLAAYIGEKWKSMSEDEKLPFRLKSQLEKEKFNRKFVSSGVESSRYLSSNKMLFLQEGTHFKCIDEYQQTDAARLFYQSKMNIQSP